MTFNVGLQLYNGNSFVSQKMVKTVKNSHEIKGFFPPAT